MVEGSSTGKQELQKEGGGAWAALRSDEILWGQFVRPSHAFFPLEQTKGWTPPSLLAMRCKVNAIWVAQG